MSAALFQVVLLFPFFASAGLCFDSKQLTLDMFSQVLGHSNTLAYESWPSYEEALLVQDTVNLPVQVRLITVCRDCCACSGSTYQVQLMLGFRSCTHSMHVFSYAALSC